MNKSIATRCNHRQFSFALIVLLSFGIFACAKNWYPAYDLSENQLYRTSSVPRLIKALKDIDSDIREESAEILGTIGTDAQEAVPALTEALRDSDADVRKAAVTAIGRIGFPNKLSLALLNFIADNDPYHSVRKAAQMTLYEIKLRNVSEADQNY